MMMIVNRLQSYCILFNKINTLTVDNIVVVIVYVRIEYALKLLVFASKQIHTNCSKRVHFVLLLKEKTFVPSSMMDETSYTRVK